jgi:signal transduction histidine kinase/CHASE1-domain containing sensor protein
MHLLTFTVPRLPWLPAYWSGVVLSCSVGGLFFAATENTIEADASERFRNMALTAQSAITGRIKTYTDVLRGSASLFQTQNELTREQFHNYVDGLNLEQEFPGIETINFARHVLDADRAAFEDVQRRDLAKVAAGYPPFSIKPAGRRPQYTVLTYIEPISAWAHKFGTDVQSLPAVDASLAESRDTGLPTSSGTKVTLNSTAVGLGMRMPIYRADMPHNTIDERRRAYVGSVGIGFSVQNLVRGALDDIPVHEVRLRLVDPQALAVQSRRQPQVLYDNMSGAERESAADRKYFHVALPVEFNRRRWEAQFSIHKQNLYTGFDAYVPWLAMLAGITSSALLYALFHTLASSRRRALKLAQDMTQELRSSEARLQISNENLRRLAAHTENIKEGERKRIAREIHDDLGQNLLALRIEADLLASRTSERHHQLHARAKRTLQQIDMTIKSVRQIINDLRPNVLDLGLGAAVDWQVAQFRQRTGIACDVMEDLDDMAIDDGCATALFRILQESLTNISRHAQATRVRVELRLLHARITMTISDNGVGMDASNRHKPGSFGLVGIEERVKILGGTFTVTSRPGAGTTIEVSVSAALSLAVPAPIMPVPALPPLAAVIRKLTRV